MLDLARAYMCVSVSCLPGSEVILQALAQRVRRIELAGSPERRFNNTLRGLKHLPVRVVEA
ncbi:MAG: hypothetical protein QOI59_3115 [Gammaproteobacteria bacterium]|jgi:cytochrome P450|nr:hypothetical protein [Gammaproteobacteria bacterium]